MCLALFISIRPLRDIEQICGRLLWTLPSADFSFRFSPFRFAKYIHYTRIYKYIQVYSLAVLVLCVTFPVELHQVARLSRYFIHKCWQSLTLYRKEMFPFRKGQIFHFVSSHFVSQSTDFSFLFVPFRFAKYRFFISFPPISFLPFRFVPFRFAKYNKPFLA